MDRVATEIRTSRELKQRLRDAAHLATRSEGRRISEAEIVRRALEAYLKDLRAD